MIHDLKNERFIAESGDEIQISEDHVVSLIIPYDPVQIEIKVHRTYGDMINWLEKEFPEANYIQDQMRPEFVYKITELQI